MKFYVRLLLLSVRLIQFLVNVILYHEKINQSPIKIDKWQVENVCVI